MPTKTLQTSILFVLVACAIWCGPTGAEEAVRVLFIGNSYTFQNDLPSMVAALAKADGQKFVVDRSVQGGFTLEEHWEKGEAQKKIKAGEWDYVILQEHSQRPVLDVAAMHKFARLFDAEIKKQDAKTVFFLTWARQHLPEMQDGLNKGYGTIAEELQAEVAPVGVAWQQALAADKKLALHKSDKSHPTRAGSYLAACVFYATLTGRSPVGLPGKIGGLSDAQAKRLQEIAWNIAQPKEE